jgi:coenzyme F420-0:L-glutamate ligase / coenzyme F420-1:gamma-L-glutamate ligase
MSIEESMRGYIVPGLPLIQRGDDLASLIEERFPLQNGDILCIASTVVAKAEGRIRYLDDYRPTENANRIGLALCKDPRFVQAVLDESEEVLLDEPFLLVVTKFGHICVNAGIDQSNIGGGLVLLLPVNPTNSAEKIRSKLSKDCAVIITDTCGRPFRCGVAGVALGCAGIAAIRDWRGQSDLFGRPLNITVEAIADEIAAAANLLLGEAAGGTPVVVFRGFSYPRFGGYLFLPEDKDVIRRRLRGKGFIESKAS